MKQLKSGYFVLALVSLLFACHIPCRARDITVAYSELPPYFSKTMDGNGVLAEIVEASLEQQGHKVIIKFYPRKRAVQTAEQGKADIAIDNRYHAEYAEKFNFSLPFYSTYVGLITLKELGFNHYDSINQIAPYKVGVGLGFDYGAEFDDTVTIKKEIVRNQESNIRKLFSGRVQLIAMPFEVFKKMLFSLNEYSIKDIVFVYPPLSRYTFHVMVSKAVKDSTVIIEDFNRGFLKIKSDGRYNKILSKHGL